MEGLETAMPGVIPVLWAEGEDAGLLDAGGDGAGGEDLGDDDLGNEGDGGAGGEGEGGEGQGEGDEKVDGRVGSKEFRDAVKAWEATPEGAKFAKQVRDDHFRAHQIATLEPGGVTGMREKYALLESVGGQAGLVQMQERIAQTDEVDAALAAGRPEALDSLGPDFDPGLAKLAPHILERVMKSDHEAYAAAILPHLMAGLNGSPLVGDLNRMIDALQAPHLDEKGKLQAVTQLLGRIGQWFDANEKKAGELKVAPVDKQRGEFDQERTKFDQEKQDHHWSSKIIPSVIQAENTKFDEMLRPYMKQLNLTPAQRQAALLDFKGKLKAACNADGDYGKQVAIYKKQKNPDPAVVANFAKTHLLKKAQAAFDAVKAERWGNRLGTGKKATTQVVPGSRSGSGNGSGGGAVTVVSAKPSPDEIDYRKTSEEDQWKGLYTLKSGKRVQFRKPA